MGAILHEECKSESGVVLILKSLQPGRGDQKVRAQGEYGKHHHELAESPYSLESQSHVVTRVTDLSPSKMLLLPIGEKRVPKHWQLNVQPRNDK